MRQQTDEQLVWIVFSAWIATMVVIVIGFYSSREQLRTLEYKVDRHSQRASNLYDTYILERYPRSHNEDLSYRNSARSFRENR